MNRSLITKGLRHERMRFCSYLLGMNRSLITKGLRQFKCWVAISPCSYESFPDY